MYLSFHISILSQSVKIWIFRNTEFLKRMISKLTVWCVVSFVYSLPCPRVWWKRKVLYLHIIPSTFPFISHGIQLQGEFPVRQYILNWKEEKFFFSSTSTNAIQLWKFVSFFALWAFFIARFNKINFISIWGHTFLSRRL